MGGFIGVLECGPPAIGGRDRGLIGLPPSRGAARSVQMPRLAVLLYQRGEEASSYVSSRWVVGLYGYLGGWQGQEEPEKTTPHPHLNSAEGLLEEFLKHGPAAFARARGQWSAFLFDALDEVLVLARDVPGSRPLYVCQSEGTLCFSTEPIAALETIGLRPHPDEDVLAGYVRMCPPEDRTPFRCLNRVRPASLLRIKTGDHGIAVLEESYWRSSERVSVHSPSGEAPAAELRRRLHVAVRRSLPRGRVAATLSGGLDSTSVLSIAAKIRSASGCEAPEALSLRFPTSRSCDEGRFIADACRHLGIPRTDVEIEGTLHLRDLLHAYSMVEVPVFINMSFFEKVAEAARSLAAPVVLTGHGGDHLLDGDPGCLDDLARQRRYADAFGVAMDLWREGTCSAYGIARVIGGRRVRRWLGRVARSGQPERQDARAEGASAGRERTGILAALETERRMSYFDGCAQLGEAMGVEFRDPLFDLDVVDFVLGLRPGVLMSGGLYRGLLREAMDGLLPTSIIYRTSKAEFTEVSSPIWEEWFARESRECLGRLTAAGVVTEAEGRQARMGTGAGVSRLRREIATVGAFWQTYFETGH